MKQMLNNKPMLMILLKKIIKVLDDNDPYELTFTWNLN